MEVLKMLLAQKHGDSNKAKPDSQTPLWGASKNVHAKVVKIVLGQEEVTSETLDKDDQSLLW